MVFKYVVAASAVMALAGCGKDAATEASAPPVTGAAAPAEAKQAPAVPKGSSSKPLSEYREITSGNELMFMYYGLLNLPVDYDQIAGVYSADYRRTSDAFKKQDIVNALKPRIDEQIALAKNSRYVIWELGYYGSALNSYDMASKTFRLRDLEPNSYYYWSGDASRYTIQFVNADAMRSLAVPDEAKAREIESLVSKGYRMKAKLYAFVQDADPSSTRVKAEILHVVVTGNNGEQIFP